MCVCLLVGGRGFGKCYWPRPQNDSALTQQAHDPQLPHVWKRRHVHVVLRAVGQHWLIKGQRKHAVNNFQIRLTAWGKLIPERGLRLSHDFLLQVDFDLFTAVLLLVFQQRFRTTATTYESTCLKWPLELGNNSRSEQTWIRGSDPWKHPTVITLNLSDLFVCRFLT